MLDTHKPSISMLEFLRFLETKMIQIYCWWSEISFPFLIYLSIEIIVFLFMYILEIQVTRELLIE